MNTVLFTSSRPLSRAENLRTVYDAYDGPKVFAQLNWWRKSPEIRNYKVMVTDEIPSEKKETVIFIPHGIEGTKKYGLDQPHGYATREECQMIDYAICQSKETVSLMAYQLGLKEEQVLPLGMPRTDNYVRKCDHMKRVYLYAPTFHTEKYVNWDTLDEMLDDDEIFIVKPHMISGELVSSEYKHIFPASKDEPTEPYLMSCNVLVTDYSSIMLDGLYARIPVVLFTRDRGYLRKHGMYFNYPEGYSSYFASNEEDLIDMLHKAEWKDEDKRTFFCGACDGHSTERVIELIRSVV